MTENHDSIEELLAGYVLRSLSGADADEADRLLSEHVPTCPLCRETLAGFQAVAGELALASNAVAPPQLAWPRIRRAMRDVPVPRRRPQFSAFAAAASVVAVLGMAATVTLGLRASHMHEQNTLFQDAIGVASRADAHQVALRDQTPPVTPLTEISAPGLEHVYLVGQDIPMPAPGHVYRVWFGSAGQYTWVGDFLPSDGLTLIRLTVDPSRYDRILITEEETGPAPAQPSGTARWSATL